MKMKNLLSGLLIPLLSSTSFASSTVEPNKTIEGITTYKYYAVIRFSPDASGDELGEGCSSGSSNHVVIEFDHNDGTDNHDTKEQFSSLLSAYFAKSNTVGFGVKDCRAGNGNNYPLIYRVDI
ncbi:hypothetical protein ACJJID_19170 [Microbulbifer sp. CnH-101-G]|uniref:hypothetical protein n=1 Tax=Microbulbifer sp. CnH-101-G TaxID=3243393 RepID=UPI0040396434